LQADVETTVFLTMVKFFEVVDLPTVSAIAIRVKNAQQFAL
jgi:hypothetical protein